MNKSLRILIAFVVLLFSASVAFAGGSGERSGGSGSGGLSGEVRIAGSSTVYPISVAMAEEFSLMHPGVNIPVQSTGTGGGFENFFIPGNTDINDASRPIGEEELVAARENGIEPLEFQVGIDALTVVVNPNADWVNDVSFDELRHIWGPENPATVWSDVRSGWPNEELELYGPTSASGTFDFFTETVMGEEGAHRSDYQGTEQDNTIVQAVSGSEYTMGYLGFAYYIDNESRVRALAVDGVEPSIETGKSGEYPLSRPLYIYVARESLARPAVREFVRFYIDSVDSQLIRDVGYVPMATEDKEAALERLEKAISEVTAE